jgi:hypothetical protein
MYLFCRQERKGKTCLKFSTRFAMGRKMSAQNRCLGTNSFSQIGDGVSGEGLDSEEEGLVSGESD